jgi:hypothetical protein
MAEIFQTCRSQTAWRTTSLPHFWTFLFCNRASTVGKAEMWRSGLRFCQLLRLDDLPVLFHDVTAQAFQFVALIGHGSHRPCVPIWSMATGTSSWPPK